VPQVWLQMGDGCPEPGRTTCLEGPRFEIGRARGADLQVGGTDVSRRHLAIELRAGVWLLQDLGSQNGCLVNGRLVQTAEIRVGDLIRLGRPGPALRVTRLDPDPAQADADFGEAETRMIGEINVREALRGVGSEQPPRVEPLPPERQETQVRPRPRPAAPPPPQPVQQRLPPPRPQTPPVPQPAHDDVAAAAQLVMSPAAATPATVVKKRGGFWPFVCGLLIGAAALFAALERERLPDTMKALVQQIRGADGGGLSIVDPGPVHETVVRRQATYQLLKLRLVEYEVKSGSRGQPVTVVHTVGYLPVITTAERTLARALEDARARLTDEFGPAAGNDGWRDRLDPTDRPRVIASWSLEVDASWRPQPLAHGEIPAVLTRTDEELGPSW